MIVTGKKKKLKEGEIAASRINVAQAAIEQQHYYGSA
jgi:hypothetical protein